MTSFLFWDVRKLRVRLAGLVGRVGRREGDEKEERGVLVFLDEVDRRVSEPIRHIPLLRLGLAQQLTARGFHWVFTPRSVGGFGTDIILTGRRESFPVTGIALVTHGFAFIGLARDQFNRFAIVPDPSTARRFPEAFGLFDI